MSDFYNDFEETIEKLNSLVQWSISELQKKDEEIIRLKKENQAMVDAFNEKGGDK